MRLVFVVRLVLALYLTSYSSLSWSQDVIYEWEPLNGVSYYEGGIEHGGSITRFRTSDTWLLLPSESNLHELRGHDSQGQPSRSSVEVRRMVISAEPKLKPESEPIEESSQASDVQVLPDSPKAELRWPAQSFIAAQLIYGSEEIRSSAGTTSLKGRNLTHGVSIYRRWIESEYGEGWVYHWHASVHKLETPIRRQREGNEVLEEESKLHWRGVIGFTSGYQLGPYFGLSSRHQLLATLGVSLWQTPVLVIEDVAVGKASLQDAIMGGAELGARYHALLRDRSELIGEAIAVPYGVGRHPGATRHILRLAYRQEFSERASLNFGYQYGKESAQPKGVCRSGIVDCREAGRSDLKQSLFLLGLDHQF